MSPLLPNYCITKFQLWMTIGKVFHWSIFITLFIVGLLSMQNIYFHTYSIKRYVNNTPFSHSFPLFFMCLSLSIAQKKVLSANGTTVRNVLWCNNIVLWIYLTYLNLHFFIQHLTHTHFFHCLSFWWEKKDFFILLQRWKK